MRRFARDFGGQTAPVQARGDPVLFEQSTPRFLPALNKSPRSGHSARGERLTPVPGAGFSHTLPPGATSPHLARTVKWKFAEENYRQFLELLEA